MILSTTAVVLLSIGFVGSCMGMGGALGARRWGSAARCIAWAVASFAVLALVMPTAHPAATPFAMLGGAGVALVLPLLLPDRKES